LVIPIHLASNAYFSIFAIMMNKYAFNTYITLFFLFILFISCSNKNSNLPGSGGEQQTDKYASLRLKADTALIYCKEKGMNTDFCFLVDMRIHSGKKRFFVWDMKDDTLIASSLCAHGSGKGSTGSKPVFSNVEGSYCTSLGKYKTGARAYSQYGINIHYKLHGLEKTNNSAFKRIVVLHSYGLMPKFEINPAHLPMGYSLGCPVIDDGLMTLIDGMLKKQNKPTLLWIYY